MSMSVDNEGASASSIQDLSIAVCNVSNDQNFANLLSVNDGGPVGAADFRPVSQNIQDLPDSARELIRFSPSHNILVLSPKSCSDSPGLDLESLNRCGHEVVILTHQSKVSLAENTLLLRIQVQTLTACFQYMKSLKHWRRRLKAGVFFALRRWAVASHYLKMSQHKAHQSEVLEQRKSFAMLVSHHTASTKAKAVEKNDAGISKTTRRHASTMQPCRPSFKPTNTNPSLTIKTYDNKPMAKQIKKRVGNFPTQQYLESKYYHTDNTPNASRSTTPTLLAAKVPTLANHPFYQHARPQYEHAGTNMPSGPAEAGFDHKALASTHITAQPEAAIQALTTRIFARSPERLAHSHSPIGSTNFSPGSMATNAASVASSPSPEPRVLLRSPLQAFQESRKTSPTHSLSLSQRTTPTRPQLNLAVGTSSTGSGHRTPTVLRSDLNSSSGEFSSRFLSVHSPTRLASSYRSPSAAEVAYARSRGSVLSVAGLQQEKRMEQEQISPSENNSLSSHTGSGVTTRKFERIAHVDLQEEKKSAVVLPVAPRRRGSGSKLQAALNQHRIHSYPHTRSSTPVDRPSAVAILTDMTQNEHTAIPTALKEIEKRDKECNVEADAADGTNAFPLATRVADNTEEDVMVFSNDEGAIDAVATASSHKNSFVKPSKHYIYLVFQKLKRKILQLQELKTFELHVALPAIEFHYKRRLRAAFYTLRVKYMEAKVARYRSYDSAINIDNFSLVKAFWRLRRHVTHRHQAWFIEQRGAKYHRFLRMSQGFSAMMQVAAYGDVPFSGDESSLQDDFVTQDVQAQQQECVSLVQRLRSRDHDYESLSSDSDREPELNIRHCNYLPDEFKPRSFDENEEKDDAVNGSALNEVHDLSVWEDRHFDSTHSPRSIDSRLDEFSAAESLAEHQTQQRMQPDHDYSEDDAVDTHSESSAEHESFAIGTTIAALGLRSADTSPSPRSPLLSATAMATSSSTTPPPTATTADPGMFTNMKVTATTAFNSLARTFPPHGMQPRSDWSGSDMHQAEIMHNISRSRSDEFPGVSGLDMWDWQDLHSVSREFISDSEGDSSRTPSRTASAMEYEMQHRSITPTLSRTPSPLQGPTFSRPVQAVSLDATGTKHILESSTPVTNDLHANKMLSRVGDQMSPILSWDNSLLHLSQPTVHNEQQEPHKVENDEGAGRRNKSHSHQSTPDTDTVDSESDISLFLSEDSQDDHHFAGVEDAVVAWSPPRQYYEEANRARAKGDHIASPSVPPGDALIEHSNIGAATSRTLLWETRNDAADTAEHLDVDLPPLPSSPCPSDSFEDADQLSDDATAHDVNQLGYISPADSDSEIVNIQQFDIFGQFSPRRKINSEKCMAAGAAYWRRTRLSQGLYALNQWVVKSQTVLTMNDILFEFQALRTLRRGFRTLRNNAIL